jgi:hypothetical protein
VTEPSECRHKRSSMPSRRHNSCDGIKPATTSANVLCDGCDGIAETRHNELNIGSRTPESTRPGDAVTASIDQKSEISAVTVRLPATLPALTPRLARALLAILVELTDVPVLEEVRYDR